MDRYNRIHRVFLNAYKMDIDNSSKIVMMSDCHRGLDDGADNFSKNENTYITALRYYFRNQFTYIELGDGDELWENSNYWSIVSTHGSVFKQLMEFHAQNRFYMLYGNHDIIKRNERWARQNLHSYYNERVGKLVPLFPDLRAYEGIRLCYTPNVMEILLLHGHQADFFNDTMWPLSRFLVRYLWKPLQMIGIKDPTSASGSRSKKRSVEQNLINWVNKENVLLIAGHTHRSMFPQSGETAYFNDGCCVRSRHITALEIEQGLITLVKWSIKVSINAALCIKREIVMGPTSIEAYLN